MFAHHMNRTDAASRSTEEIWKLHRHKQARSAKKRSPQEIALRNRIAVQNDDLAKKIAHRMLSQCQEPYDDLLQLARIGLLKAIERFDPATGNAFSSFAVPYIRGEIQHHLRDEWGTVKVPRRSIELASRVKRIVRIMAQHGQEVSEEQAASALRLPQEKWRWVQQAASGNLTVSLDECKDVASDAYIEVWESQESTAKPSSSWVPRAVRSLPEPSRTAILEAYFVGLDLEAIAQRQGMKVSMVKLWIRQGLLKLKEHKMEMRTP